MKKLLGDCFVISFLAMTFSFNSCFSQFSSRNINLLSHFDDTLALPEPMFGIRYNNVFGWADTVKHREYAILSAPKGTYFVDVTNPTAPVLCDFVKGKRDSCIFRDAKTFQNYAYMVSDDAPPNSLQIADMSYLPDSVHVVYDSDTMLISARSIFVEGNKLYAANPRYNLTNKYSMAVYSLANPALPTLLRSLDQDYTNVNIVDYMEVRNDTVYANGALDGFFIYQFTANNAFSLLASMSPYPLQGYNHSCALTGNSKTLLLCDASTPNFPAKVMDVSDLNNLNISTTFQDTTTTTFSPHGAFVKQEHSDFAYIAYYQDGLQTFNISNTQNIFRTGYFDTYPLKLATHKESCVCNYTGCNSAFVNFPSGNIITCDFQFGLFVLDASLAAGVNESVEKDLQLQVYPNPTAGKFWVSIPSQVTGSRLQITSMEIYNVFGEKMQVGSKQVAGGNSSQIQIDISHQPTGIYFLNARTDQGNVVKKIILSR